MGEGLVISFSGIAETTGPSYLTRLTTFLNRQLPFLVMAWIAGLLFFAVRTAGGYWFVHQLRQTGTAPDGANWQVRLEKIATRMKIRRPVRMLESIQVSVPLVIGHFKPLILMPVGLVNQLSVAEVEAILAHELAHIRRHDFLLNLLQSLLEILYYFNPAAWYISTSIRTERENCCDDWAVAVCGSSLTYVHALVQLQERAVSAPPFALSITGDGKPLLQRVRRILNQPNNKKTIMERFTATLLLLAAVAVFSISASQPDEETAKGDEIRPVLVSLAQDLDSIPPPSRNLEIARIVKQKGDQRMELTLENGEVTEFKVDGEVIPREKQTAYQEDINAMRADMEHAPPPPPAPRAGIPPPPPPPPPPPAPRIEREIKVTTEMDDEGKVMIWVNEEDGKPMEISVDDAHPQVYFYSGEDDRIILREAKERAMEDAHRTMEDRQRAMEDHRRGMEQEMEIMVEKQQRVQADRERIMHEMAPFPKGGSLKSAIERELRRDGYIQGNGSYDFELSGKKLVINGKKESDVIFEKYKKIYERETGLTLSKDSKIEIEE
ncbi:MAG: M56 family metallopeptidase [Saprospirales bacterium]|nr:M56 family metallopeptidase [Saprospirales bacterium]